MCARRDHDVHETASRRIAVELELGFFDTLRRSRGRSRPSVFTRFDEFVVALRQAAYDFVSPRAATNLFLTAPGCHSKDPPGLAPPVHEATSYWPVPGATPSHLPLAS
jgi:hypothetical protein